MPSFDAVSELNMMEVENAWNQAQKEIAQRFDFKGTSTSIERDKELNFLLKASSEGRCEAALGVLMEKLAKRGVPMSGLDRQCGLPLAQLEQDFAVTGEGVLVIGVQGEALLETAAGPGILLPGEVGIRHPHVEFHGVGVELETFLQEGEGLVEAAFVVELVCVFIVVVGAQEPFWHQGGPPAVSSHMI